MLPIQFVYGAVAICGGVARYLNSFASGNGFSWRILVASAFVSGFSGWMFATLGTVIDMPQAVVYIMAGSGGFFGEQKSPLRGFLLCSFTTHPSTFQYPQPADEYEFLC